MLKLPQEVKYMGILRNNKLNELEQNESTKGDDDVVNHYRKESNLLTSEQIIAIRKKYRLTQLQFAKLLGINKDTLISYENGALQDIAHDNLIRLISDINNFIYLWKLRKYMFYKDEQKCVEEENKIAL